MSQIQLLLQRASNWQSRLHPSLESLAAALETLDPLDWVQWEEVLRQEACQVGRPRVNLSGSWSGPILLCSVKTAFDLWYGEGLLYIIV